MSKQTVSLQSLDVTAQCDQPHEFEYIDPAGNKTGVFLSVLGAHSQKVQQHGIREINRIRRQAALDRKRGKGADFNDFEEDLDSAINDAAIRIVSWRGIDDPCTFENAVQLCRVNPVIRQQVIDASSELANFTKSK